LGAPLADTVATVGTGVDRARQALEEPAAEQAPAGPEVARHLDTAVRQVVTAPVAEAAPLPEPSEITLPEPDQGVERPRVDAPRPEAAAAEAAPAEPAAHTVRTSTLAPAAEERSVAASGTADTDPDTAVAPAPTASGTTATATATPSGSAAQGGALIAGYLSAPGAPTPAPGLVQAAWHVLRSVPAEDADEPTFSPD
ncbi:hypothetical protein, partial [Nocardiopsis sp. CC223A]|uniref:hypothetical protein n=1 Tax=Nocardiopsis sp. CC223A TaxID=3044051 RepID=UPI002795B2CA